MKQAVAWAVAVAVAAAPMASPVPASAAEQPAGLSGSVPAGVLRATLDNGLRVVIVPDPLAPVVTTNLNYLVGSNDAPPGFPGTAHALEHMMFRGSTGLDKDQLAELGALLGGVYNASTTETVTQYTYTVPAQDLDLALRSEALRMRGLSLTEADWQQERGAIEQEVSRDLSSPFYLYSAQAQSILFHGTPYENDALGTRPSFDKTDAKLLRTFYDQWYAPNNAILVIAGDVQPDDAMKQVRAAFDAIPRRDLPAHAVTVLNPVQAQAINLPTSFSVGIAALSFRMPGLWGKSFAAADVLGDVLGSQRGELFGLVPAGRALMAQFSYSAKSDVGIGLALAAFPRGGDPAPVLADLRRVIANVVQNGVSPELVEASKRQELAQLGFENDSISGLASSWSHALAQQGLDSPEDLAQAYASVTVDDVNRVARQVLDLDHAVTAILAPQAGARPTQAGFGGAESFSSPPDHPVALPEWAATALADVQAPAAPTPPVVSVLPNGLRLVVQPERVSHTVSVYARVREVSDLQEPPGKEGVSELTGQLFDYGTEARSRLAYRKAVDDIAAQVGTGTDFSLKVLTPQFEAGMRLLAEGELHPAFPADAFKVAQDQLAQSLAGQLQSPDYLFGLAVNRALVPAGDPTLRRATPATVRGLTLDDVRAYHAAVFRPDLTTMVVLGDVSPEEAQRVVAATFGPWQAEGPRPVLDLPGLSPNPASVARVPDPNRLQDRVTLTETVGLPVSSPDRYTLELGNVILGGGFSSRLYRDLRVKTGYVYSVSSALSWQRTRAGYSVTFGADGGNVGKARDLVLHNLREMQTVPVSDGDLVRAKAQVLRRLPMQRASVSGIAQSLLRLSDLGLPLDQERVAVQRYMQITAPEIQQAFAQWLRPEALAQVVEGPPVAQ